MFVNTILSAATATGAGGTVSLLHADRHSKSFTATVTGTGAVSATVNIEVSLNGTSWLTVGTITLSGTTSATDGFAHDAPWAYYRANCTALSGTSASLTVLMGR